MKTKIKTLISVCILGIIGFMNLNAISDNKKEVFKLKPETLEIESVLNDEALIYSPQTFSSIDIETEIEYNAIWESLAEEISIIEESISYSAQSFSTVDIQNEIDQSAGNQILPEENLMIEIKYSAKSFSDLDFDNEIKNRE